MTHSIASPPNPFRMATAREFPRPSSEKCAAAFRESSPDATLSSRKVARWPVATLSPSNKFNSGWLTASMASVALVDSARFHSIMRRISCSAAPQKAAAPPSRIPPAWP
ncbi:hypothetical protein G6F50_018495 [Rhizopus delemar]|uniref:Uncharacterized protein n=1 Tax=Rhizopus delemar TaxID=936053 RepID=A0A9P6XMH5_9FUNG|nr:hypothetical protein G6F50_018495 [Rhizopus delemar]